VRALALIVLVACSPPSSDRGSVAWRHECATPGRDTIVFFALPGRDLSERMEQETLRDAAVLAALAHGGFDAVRLDGFADQQLYAEWIGGGEGMGVCALDAEGRAVAARAGLQDAPELAAWIDFVAARRPAVAAAQHAVAAAPQDPQACYRLGLLRLELGQRSGTEPLLAAAGEGGIADAWQRLARLFALDGQLQRAREWLLRAPPSASAMATEGYLLFKERHYVDAIGVLDAALRERDLGDDRQWVELCLGKALHESGRDARAIAVLEGLLAERTGSTSEGAAVAALAHIRSPDHGHSH
jgi:tetratricopeptide (TPR) repeat protein